MLLRLLLPCYSGVFSCFSELFLWLFVGQEIHSLLHLKKHTLASAFCNSKLPPTHDVITQVTQNATANPLNERKYEDKASKLIKKILFYIVIKLWKIERRITVFNEFYLRLPDFHDDMGFLCHTCSKMADEVTWVLCCLEVLFEFSLILQLIQPWIPTMDLCLIFLSPIMMTLYLLQAKIAVKTRFQRYVEYQLFSNLNSCLGFWDVYWCIFPNLVEGQKARKEIE